MLDKLKEAQALAEDAEDRVLVHRGLLTPAEAERRAAARRPAGAAGSAQRSAQEPTGVAVSARSKGLAGRLPTVSPAPASRRQRDPARAGPGGGGVRGRGDRAEATPLAVDPGRGRRRDPGRGGGDRHPGDQAGH